MGRWVWLVTIGLVLSCSGEKRVVRLDISGEDGSTMDGRSDSTLDVVEDGTLKDIPGDLAPDLEHDSLTDAADDIPHDLPLDLPEDLPTDLPGDLPLDLPTDLPEDLPTDLPEEVETDLVLDVPVDICQPDCAGVECGADGCGGVCGVCAANSQCVDGACVPICVANCSGKDCGSDGCGGSCGTCPGGTSCNVNGACTADCPADADCPVPDLTYCNSSLSGYWRCEYKVDGCLGKVFHPCSNGESCNLSTQNCTSTCTSHPVCTAAGIWFCNDSATGYFQCQETQPDCIQLVPYSCPTGQLCTVSGCQDVCLSDPGCTAEGISTCSTNTAYRTCNEVEPGCFQWSPPVSCGFNEECLQGACVPTCVPNCSGLECGSDGCGGSCGECAATDACPFFLCASGLCEASPACCVDDSQCDDGAACTIDTCLGGVCTHSWSTTPGCCAPTLYFEGFDESGLATWVTTNSSLESGWRLASTLSTSGSHSLYYGNVEETDYLVDNQGSIEWSHWMELPWSPSLTLQFQLWMDIEPAYDALSVVLITNSGEVILDEMDAHEEFWQTRSYDLSAFAGQSVKLRFHFESDYLYSFSGAFIDDIEIVQQCCQEDLDCNDGNPCTQGVCPAPDSFCEFVTVVDCCLANAECDDGDACTADSCADNSCIHDWICCATDGDCNDGDDVCTLDSCVGGQCVFEWTYAEGCCQPELWGDDFEEGVLSADYSVESPTPKQTTWFVSSLDSFAGSSSLFCSIPTGTGYGNDVDTTLVGPTVELSAVAVEPALVFQIKYATEKKFDELSVGLQVDGQFIELEIVDGNSGDQWVEKSYDLSPYVGSTIQPRFRFTSDSSIQSGFGIRIDDLAVVQGCCLIDADCDDGNPCTLDTCPTPNSVCSHTPVAGCCLLSAECNDGNVCTEDVCTVDHTCQHTDECCAAAEDCDNGDPCTVDSCINGMCEHAPTGLEGCCEAPFFFDDFSTDRGWLYQTWWERGPATSSYCAWQSFQDDPAMDHSGSSDNYLAGVLIGDCITSSMTQTGPFFLVTPVIDLSNQGSAYLTYWRFLNTDGGSWMNSKVEVFDGLFWNLLWQEEGGSFSDNNWTSATHDLTPWVGGQVRIRFSVEVSNSTQLFASPSWSIDDVRVSRTLSDWCCQYTSECPASTQVCTAGHCL